jgi:hypothetical protein
VSSARPIVFLRDVDERGWLTIVRGNPASDLEGLGLALAARVRLTRVAR